MTQAEKIAGGGKQPEAVAAATVRVAEQSARCHEAIEEAMLSREIAREHMARDGNLSLADAEKAAKKTAAARQEDSTYAYSFIELDDGSAVAVYTTRYGEPVQYEPFESLAHTRFWHPTRNPAAE